jgi:hypothetical protein
MTDRAVERAIKKRVGGGEYHKIAPRLQAQTRVRELGSIIFNMLEHIDVEECIKPPEILDILEYADDRTAKVGELAGLDGRRDLGDLGFIGLQTNPAIVPGMAKCPRRTANARADFKDVATQVGCDLPTKITLPSQCRGE